MVNPELVRRLLKELEAEKRSPVQLQADTPQSEGEDSGLQVPGRTYFGSFMERPVVVKRLPELDEKYFHDVGLIEGEYESLAELERRIEEIDVLYNFPRPGSPIERVYQLVEKETGEKLSVYPLCAFKLGSDEKSPSKDLCEILDRAGVTYLKYSLVARPDGVYDDRTDKGGGLTEINETKVAEITFMLVQ